MEGEEKRKEELNEVWGKMGSFSGFIKGVTIFAQLEFAIVIGDFSAIFTIAIEKSQTFLPAFTN